MAEQHPTGGRFDQRGHDFVSGTATMRPRGPALGADEGSSGFHPLEAAQEMASSVAGQTGDLLGDVRACMRRYPVAVFFTGMAVGCALAFLWQNEFAGSRRSFF